MNMIDPNEDPEVLYIAPSLYGETHEPTPMGGFTVEQPFTLCRITKMPKVIINDK